MKVYVTLSGDPKEIAELLLHLQNSVTLETVKKTIDDALIETPKIYG